MFCSLIGTLPRDFHVLGCGIPVTGTQEAQDPGH